MTTIGDLVSAQGMSSTTTLDQTRTRHRLARAVLVAVAALCTLFGGMQTAQAGAWDCKSSGYACTPGYTGANASSTWAWGYYGGSWATTTTGYHNCTLYAAYRLALAGLPNPGRSWGNAAQWGTALGYNTSPAVGAVAWWPATSGNSFGHVAIVDQISGGNVFITADNYSSASTGGYTSSGWIAASSVPGYIHLRDGGGGSASTFSTAFEANTNNLWNVDANGAGDLRLGMMPGTSPSIAKLAGGGYELAFQANTGNLWTTGTAGTKDWGLGMMNGTSPAITGLAAGGYEVAFQANTGSLWYVGQGGGSIMRGDRGLGMMTKTSPSIASIPRGGFEVAMQANTGNLWVIGEGAGSISRGDWGLGMMNGTSPAITGLAAGGYEVAFQANTSSLWTVGQGGGSATIGSRALGMNAGSSAAIAGS